MNVALYLRASTAKQSEEGYSLDYQRDKLIDYARIKDWEVVEEYMDAGESGRTTKRPAFNKMVEDAQQNMFKVVLVYKLDRFSRSLQDLLNVINILKDHGVSVWSVTQSYDDNTPEGRLMRNMLGSFAQFESEMIGARVRDGMARRAREGDWNTSPPFGFEMLTEENGTLRWKDDEVKTVKLIYRLYLENNVEGKGLSMNTLAEMLNQENIRTKWNGRWNPNTIRRILSNRIYTGVMKYKGELIKINLDSIIEIEDFTKVQEIRKLKARKTGKQIK